LKKSLQNLNKQTKQQQEQQQQKDAHKYFASFAIDVQHDFVGVQHAHVQQPQLYQIAAVPKTDAAPVEVRFLFQLCGMLSTVNCFVGVAAAAAAPAPATAPTTIATIA